jgi:hypothetical protein
MPLRATPGKSVFAETSVSKFLKIPVYEEPPILCSSAGRLGLSIRRSPYGSGRS